MVITLDISDMYDAFKNNTAKKLDTRQIAELFHQIFSAMKSNQADFMRSLLALPNFLMVFSVAPDPQSAQVLKALFQEVALNCFFLARDNRMIEVGSLDCFPYHLIKVDVRTAYLQKDEIATPPTDLVKVTF